MAKMIRFSAAVSLYFLFTSSVVLSENLKHTIMNEHLARTIKLLRGLNLMEKRNWEAKLFLVDTQTILCKNVYHGQQSTSGVQVMGKEGRGGEGDTCGRRGEGKAMVEAFSNLFQMWVGVNSPRTKSVVCRVIKRIVPSAKISVIKTDISELIDSSACN